VRGRELALASGGGVFLPRGAAETGLSMQTCVSLSPLTLITPVAGASLTAWKPKLSNTATFPVSLTGNRERQSAPGPPAMPPVIVPTGEPLLFADGRDGRRGQSHRRGSPVTRTAPFRLCAHARPRPDAPRARARHLGRGPVMPVDSPEALRHQPRYLFDSGIISRCCCAHCDNL